MLVVFGNVVYVCRRNLSFRKFFYEFCFFFVDQLDDPNCNTFLIICTFSQLFIFSQYLELGAIRKNYLMIVNDMKIVGASFQLKLRMSSCFFY